jgi:hypothetical protein
MPPAPYQGLTIGDESFSKRMQAFGCLTLDIKHIVEAWEELLKAHQDTRGQVKQLRWVKCWEMWQEIERVVEREQMKT